MSWLNRDTIGGALVLLLGLIVLTVAVPALPMGSLTDMGPGFVPVSLGVLLLALGAMIIVTGYRSGASAITASPLRSTVLITVSPIAFAALVRPFGLTLAVFAAALLASIAGPGARIGQSLVIAVSLTVLGIALFSYGLGVSAPLVGPLVRWW